MYLFLNAAFSFLEVSLFNEDQLLFSKRWTTKTEEKDFAEILRELDKEFQVLKEKKLKAVLVSKGPGRFMALRTAVATAQTLAYLQKIPLLPFSSQEYFNALEKNADILFLQQVALNEVFIQNKREKLEYLESLFGLNQTWTGDVRTKHLLPENWEEKELEKIDLAFLHRLKNMLIETDHISIEYRKEPQIGVVK